MLPGALAIRLLGFTAHSSFIIAAAAASAPEMAQEPVRRCGITQPSKELVDAHEKLAKNKEQHQTRSMDTNDVINIDMYINVVMRHQDDQILANDTMLNKQMEVLNESYNKSKFHFNLKKITRVNNATWALDEDSSAMRRQLRQGDQKTVNVYILESLQGNDFGVATYPDIWGHDGLDADHVSVAVRTIVGSSYGRVNRGITLVHEVGHWLGLVHPHEYGCDKGDFVDDTPAMARASYGCTEGLDSCPGPEYPGEDPIHNYMGYGPDSCLSEFTPGQTQRMHDLWETFRLSKNVKEISWKNDCEAAFEPLLYDCLADKSQGEQKCAEEYAKNIHLPCTLLSPSTKRECLDRFAPYKAKCNSDACKVDFLNSYERYCAAEQRVKQDASDNNQEPKLSQTEADKAWRLVCRQASMLVQEQCTKSECQNEMVRGNLFKQCAKTPQDDKQCQDVLDPLVQLCETDQCQRGLEALKSKECAARKDLAAEYNGGVVTEWDLNGDMAPMTRDEWGTRCNAIPRAIVRSCQEKKKCIDDVMSRRLSSVCQKDRPRAQNDCKGLFSAAKWFNCQSSECMDEVTDLENKACAGRRI